MNSRERVFTALDHSEPDRVPIDFWVSKEALEKIKRHFGCAAKDEVLDKIDVDLRYIEGPVYTGPELNQHPDGSEDDIWGVRRKAAYIGEGEGRGVIKSVTRYPLKEIKTIEEANRYEHWPSADWYDYSYIEDQCKKHLFNNRVVVFEGDRTNRVAQLKTYMYLRGTENAFMDMVLNKDLFEFIILKIRSFCKEYLTRILEAARGKIDIFMTGDDFGGQNNLLVSRDTWLELLGPGFNEYMRLIKAENIYTMYHTCGSVFPIIKDMADMGLDILQSLQPEAAQMDGKVLKNEFGKIICFNGSLSIQETLPSGVPEDIKKEVKNRVETLAPGGGFIIGTAHNIQSDVPLENLIALIEAYNEYL